VTEPALTNRERWALALLAVSGCVFLPFALDRFVFPKLAVLALGALLAMTAPARGRLPRAVVAVCCLGGALLLAAALAGATPDAQLLGRAPRYEGLLVLSLYMTVLAAGARLSTGRAPGASAWWLRWLAVAALAIAVEAVLEAAGLRPLASDVARPGSLLGNASDEGAWGVLALGPLAAVAVRAGGRWRIAGALAAATIVVCSGSRGALLGVGVAAAVMIVLTRRPGQRAALLAGAAVIAVGVLALPATRERALSESPLAADTAHGRELAWGETLRMIAARPLLGVGPSGFEDALPAYHDQEYERDVGPQNPLESPHNIVLQAAANGGVMLALLAVALAALVAQAGLAARRRQATGGEEALVVGMLAGLCGYAATLMFFFTTPGSTPLALFMAGALLARPSAPPPPEEERHAPGARSARLGQLAGRALQAALALLAAVFAAAAVAEIPLREAITAAASDRFGTANADFRLARDLRPWDGSVAATAEHAYATLTRDGIAAAASAGAPWAAEAVSDYPNDSQALADGAVIEATRGRRGKAEAWVTRALARDPENPELRDEAAIIQTGRR